MMVREEWSKQGDALLLEGMKVTPTDFNWDANYIIIHYKWLDLYSASPELKALYIVRGETPILHHTENEFSWNVALKWEWVMQLS